MVGVLLRPGPVAVLAFRRARRPARHLCARRRGESASPAAAVHPG